MDLLLLFQVVAFTGVFIGSYGIYRRYTGTKRRALPADQSAMKGKPSRGVAYAFTLGMLPWAKESTRIHMIAYLRGIGFHLGIFSAIGLLLVSPLLGLLPDWLRSSAAVIIGLGAILGAAGGVTRMVEHNLRALSALDDHFAVWLVTVWLVLSALAAWSEKFLIVFYVLSAITFAYIPMGKIRHCLYFFFSRTFFGKFFGRRAVFPHAEPLK